MPKRQNQPSDSLAHEIGIHRHICRFAVLPQQDRIARLFKPNTSEIGKLSPVLPTVRVDVLQPNDERQRDDHCVCTLNNIKVAIFLLTG